MQDFFYCFYMVLYFLFDLLIRQHIENKYTGSNDNYINSSAYAYYLANHNLDSFATCNTNAKQSFIELNICNEIDKIKNIKK